MSDGFICLDNEYIQLGQAYRTLYSDIENNYTGYLAALNLLTAEGVTSGHVSTNLRTFQSSARSAQGAFDSKAHSTSNTFISSLRAADNLG